MAMASVPVYKVGPFDVVDVLGATSSAVFRFGAYLALRWLPGRFAPYAIPAAFLIFLVFWLIRDAKLRSLESQSSQAIRANASLHPHINGGANGQIVKTLADGITADDVRAATAVKDEPAPAIGRARSWFGGGKKGKTTAASYAQVVRNGGAAAAEVKDEQDKKAITAFDPSAENALTTTAPALTTSPLLPLPPRPNALSWITGSPTSSRSFNLFNLAVNALLLLAVVDMIWVPYLFHGHKDLAFARVGATGPTWVKLSARVPHSRKAEKAVEKVVEDVKGREGARVLYRMTRPTGQWQIGPEIITSNETDWVGTVTVDYLLPSTEYEYQFTLPLEPTKRHPLFPSTRKFKTAPDPRLSGAGTHFTFASTSCVKPGFPWSPVRSHNAIPGARHLVKAIKSEAIDFVMFLGDFIYSDVPRYPNHQVESYHKRYRQVYASKDWQKVIESTPTMHIYDDHEIYNDWAGEGNDSKPAFASANSAYQTYIGHANPPPLKSDVNYFTYTYGDAAFFVWDTRRYRTANHAHDDESKTMLGREQKDAFVKWLGQVNQTTTFKFVVSSAPFMTLWKSVKTGGMANDTWGGFVTERNEIMDIMQYVPNIIVISGDRHEFAAATIRNSVLEVSTSPLSFFYIPLVRTLSQKNGLGKTGEEQLLKYLPIGISKFSTFEVDGRVFNKPTVTLKVHIDGKVAWKLTILGKPVHRVGSAVGHLRKSLRELFRRLLV